MPKFSYSDIVTARAAAGKDARAGEQAWIVAIVEDRLHFTLQQFPPGVVYSIEFEDGTAIDVHEGNLVLIEIAIDRNRR
jgi:hypothetical protein